LRFKRSGLAEEILQVLDLGILASLSRGPGHGYKPLIDLFDGERLIFDEGSKSDGLFLIDGCRCHQPRVPGGAQHI